MRRSMRTRAIKRFYVRTPGKRTVLHFRQKKTSHATCGSCCKKLNRPRLTSMEVRKLSKSSRRPERPYPELCSKCMREKIKSRLR